MKRLAGQGRNQKKTLDLSQLTWNGFMVNNLFPATLGNMVSGVMVVGVLFWFIYLLPGVSFLSLNILFSR